MNILVIQNRMGIGDMVIFLPFIEAIAKKYKTPITLLIKENSKAREYTKNLQFIKKIIYLKRDSKDDLHNGLSGFFKLKNEIKNNLFDTVFIFNSSLRYRLICKIAGIKSIYQYPLFKKSNQLLETIHEFDNEIFLIGVGGVFTKEDYESKIKSGASLVQIYNGFIFEGPAIVKNILSR